MRTLALIFLSLLCLATLSRSKAHSPEDESVLLAHWQGTSWLSDVYRSPAIPFEMKKITFPSKDGLVITADVYESGNEKNPWILMCHQAGFSRGEYTEAGSVLKTKGFNCLAIDQRSGKSVNGVLNETAKRAKEKNLPMEYADAEQDILAAIDYLYDKYKKPVIIVGSSYSASLALKIANGNKKISKVAAFSPGEYFEGTNIAAKIKGMKKPVFVTSSKAEAENVKELMKGIDSSKLTHFVPVHDGDHGSKVLWEKNQNYKEYWEALLKFLEK